MQPTTFVLTLKDEVGRRSQLLQQLDLMGLPYELWFGIDGRKGVPSKYESMIDRQSARKNLYREMTDVEFACALSHNAIYRAIIKRKLTAAVILEDDARVGEPFRAFVAEFRQPPCELLLLDHKKGGVSRRNVCELRGGLTAYRVVLPPELTTGYYLTRAAAFKMVELSHPISYVADWPCNIAALECCAVLPRLVSQPPAGFKTSHIHAQRHKLKSEGRSKRFLTSAYWKRWWLKHTSKKLI